VKSVGCRKRKETSRRRRRTSSGAGDDEHTESAAKARVSLINTSQCSPLSPFLCSASQIIDDLG
jgi:hypothetical protein